MKFGRQRRGGMRKKEQATCIAEPHYLIVRQPDDSSEQDQENWALSVKTSLTRCASFWGGKTASAPTIMSSETPRYCVSITPSLGAPRLCLLLDEIVPCLRNLF